MKASNLSYIIFLFSLFINSCTEKEGKTTYINKSNFNLLIVPDLSNRINQSIHPKPLHDTVIINTILDSIPQFLKTDNRTVNQLDRYKIDFINRGILNDEKFYNSDFEISFLRFKNKLKMASDYKRNQLHSDISKLKNEATQIYSYASVQSSGSDIWNYFNETIHSSLSSQIDTTKITNKKSIISQTRNKVVLLTDGYIETINKTSGYQLNQDLVTKIRTEFLKSKSNDLKNFILTNPQFLINKLNNNLENTDVLVLEITDRSLDINGVARFHPTDLEIIKIIWTDWLTKSGVRNVQIHTPLSNRKDIYPIIKNFLEIK